MVGGSGAARLGEAEARGLIAKAARSALRDAEKAVAEDAARRGETRTAKQVLKDMESDLVGRLSQGDKAAVDAFARAARADERSITPRMEQLVSRIPGGKLVGLEYAAKGEESLARKVATDMTLNGATVDEALGGIKDSVRYTVQAGREDYTRVAQRTVDEMTRAGFEPVKFKNFWGDGGYQGINSFWRDPETGRVIEMQLHSAESFDAKMATHGIYDLQRLPGLDPGVGQQLDGLQNSVFGHVATPRGAPEIGLPSGGSG